MAADQNPDGTRNQAWELTLLGRWELKRSGKVQQLGISEQRLIAALSVLGPKPSGALAGLVWPDDSANEASAKLQASLAGLTGQLPGLLSASQDSLFLDPQTRVDYQRLCWLLADIRNGAAPPEGTTILENAHLLPGWHQDWVLLAQERLHLQRMTALEILATHFLNVGDPYRAIEAARLAASIEPLSEDPQLILLRAHRQSGNTAEAVQTLQDFRDRLRTEVGLAPSARFTELLQAPRSSDPRPSE